MNRKILATLAAYAIICSEGELAALGAEESLYQRRMSFPWSEEVRKRVLDGDLADLGVKIACAKPTLNKNNKKEFFEALVSFGNLNPGDILLSELSSGQHCAALAKYMRVLCIKDNQVTIYRRHKLLGNSFPENLATLLKKTTVLNDFSTYIELFGDEKEQCLVSDILQTVFDDHGRALRVESIAKRTSAASVSTEIETRVTESYQVPPSSDLNGMCISSPFDQNKPHPAQENLASDVDKMIGRLVEDERSGRVVVAVFDNGVDPFHPALAHKILRPDPAKITKIEAEIKKLKSKIASMEEWSMERDALEAELEDKNNQLRDEKIEHAKGMVGLNIAEPEQLPLPKDREMFMDQEGVHGTHVAGIASEGSDKISILPVSFELHPQGEKVAFEQALKFVRANGVKVINMSMVMFKGPLQAKLDFIKRNPDILFVIAAGNDGQELKKPRYNPYHAPNMLVVGSASNEGRVSEFSNYSSSYVDVSAPGEDIESAVPLRLNVLGNGTDSNRSAAVTARLSGTSMATPKVTNLAAKILLINPNLTPEQVAEIIRSTAIKHPSLDGKNRVGGAISEERALEAARRTKTAP